MKRLKRMFVIMFVIIATFSYMVLPVYASEPQPERKEEELSEEEKEKQAEEAAFVMPVETNELKEWPKGPGTHGEAAIVMEADTGAILYAKNIDAHEFPASITKVLTALVALENGKMSDPVAFSKNCVSFLQPGDSSIGLKEGNAITLEQALYATLLASANEAAYAVGENVGKNAGHDYNWFIERMNTKCKELGGTNSNFANTSGLHDINHYTSAKDMALIGSELFRHPEFFKIVQTPEYRIPATATCEEHVFQQKHKMLIQGNSKYYEYAVGGKTGYTSDARSTLITMADNKEMRLVCVVLRTYGTNVYPDTKALLDYGFSNFKKVSVAGEEKSEDIAEILEDEEDGYVVLPEGVTFDDLEMKMTVDSTGGRGMDKQADLTYTYEGYPVGSARAKVSETYLKKHRVKIKEVKTEDNPDNNKEAEQQRTNILISVFVVIVVLVALLLRAFVKRKRGRGRHRGRRGRK